MPNRLRPAYSLIEVVLVITIIGLITLMGLHQLHVFLDRIATRDAVRDAGALVARARDEAVALHAPVSMRIDTISASIDLRSRGAALLHSPLGDEHGISLTTSRDSITFDLRGLGYGPANLTLVARRGSARDTLVVSRLGRVRD